MPKSRSGFTIVELLIVIVIISILATITIVAYNGIQQRARDTKRSSDVASIQKVLEVYKAQSNDDTYPYTGNTTAGNLPAGFTASGAYGCPTCYAFSVATDGTWLKYLKNSGITSNVPVSEPNDNSHYYMYFSTKTGGVNCPRPFYVLVVVGWEGTPPPSSHSVICTGYANFTVAPGRAVFSNL